MVSEAGRHRLLSACLAASTLTVLVSGSALLAAALAWPLAASWVRATRPASTALLVLLALDSTLGLAVALRSAFLALACRARAAPRKVRLLHPVSAHLVCLLLPCVLLNLAVVVWCVVGMALSPRLSRSRILWAALGYYDEARADSAASRQAMDDTQATLECCGFDGPADWHPWANDPIGRLQQHDADPAKEDEQDKARAAPSDIPESCCAGDADKGAAAALPADREARRDATAACRAWERGCFYPLANALVVLHLAVGSAALMMAAMLFVVAATLRLAQTSARAAMEAGDPGAAAPAWLLRPPRPSDHDAVPMTARVAAGGPARPGDEARRRAAKRGGRHGGSDSDPDQPDKILFAHIRGREHAAGQHSPSATSTSTDSSLTFELTETPLPTSEERFILAEYAFSPGVSPGTSTTSSWGLATDSDGSGAPKEPSPGRALRRARSDGDVARPRTALWAEKAAPHTKRNTTAATPATAPTTTATASITACGDASALSIRADVGVAVSARAATLLSLEQHTKAVLTAAVLGGLPGAAASPVPQPRPPTRMTSESSTQTAPAGQSMPRLHELFRDHGIPDRQQDGATAKAAQCLLGAGDSSPEPVWPARQLAPRRAEQPAPKLPRPVPAPQASSGVRKVADASSSSASSRTPSTPSSRRSAHTLADLPLPPTPGGQALNRRPLPPAPARRRLKRCRRRAAPRTSSDSGDPAPRTAAPRPSASRGAGAKTCRGALATQAAVALWVQDSRHWLAARAHDDQRAHDEDAVSAASTEDKTATLSRSSDSSPPDSRAPLASSSTSSSSVAASPPSSPRPPSPPSSSSDQECGAALVPAVVRPSFRCDVSVAVTSSAATLSLSRAGRRVLYRVPLHWLLSGMRLRPLDVDAALDWGPRGAAAPRPARQLRPLPPPAPPVEPDCTPLPPPPPTLSPQLPRPGTISRDLKAALRALQPRLARPATLSPSSRQHAAEGVPRGAAGPGRGAVTKWGRKSRRRTTLTVRELLRHVVPAPAPRHSAEDCGADGPLRRAAKDVPTALSAPALGLRAAAPTPTPRPATPCRKTLSPATPSPNTLSPPRPEAPSPTASLTKTPSSALVTSARPHPARPHPATLTPATLGPTRRTTPAPATPSPGARDQSTDPYWTSTQLTLDRRKSSAVPPKPPQPPQPPQPTPTAARAPPQPDSRGTGRKRSLSLGSTPVAKRPVTAVSSWPVDAVAPPRPAEPCCASAESSSSDQCPHCDCWRAPPGALVLAQSHDACSSEDGDGEDDGDDDDDPCRGVAVDPLSASCRGAAASEPVVGRGRRPEQS